MTSSQAPQPEPVTWQQACDAIDSLDDYARMMVGVDPSGPRELLYRFVEQMKKAAEDAEPMDMALCESQRLVLREGQIYRFRRVGDCETCATMSAASREAYGQPPAIPSPEGALAEAANKALAAYAHHESNKQAGLGVVSGPALHAAMDTLRAALAAQPQQEAWAGSGAFIQHVQVAAGLAGATGHWPDEFLAWHRPDQWLGGYRAAAVFIGAKIAALAAPAPQAAPAELPDVDLCKLISSHEVYQYHPGALHEFSHAVIAEFCRVNGIPAPQTKEATNDR